MDEPLSVAQLQAELAAARALLADALAEKQRLAATAQHLNVLQNALDGVFFTNERHDLLFINRTLLHLLGYAEADRERLLGAPLPITHWSNPRDFQVIYQELQQQGWVEGRIVRLAATAGTPVLVSLSAIGIRDTQGAFTGAQFRLRPLNDPARRGTAELRAENRELTALTAIARSVLSTMNVAEVMQHLLETVQNLFEVQATWVYLKNREEVLQLVAHSGLSESDAARVGAAAHAFLGFRNAADTGRPRLFNYTSPTSERLIIAQRLGMDNLAVAPLLAHEQTIGVLVIASSGARLLLESDLLLLERIAQYTGLAVSNAMLYDDLQGAYQELKLAQEQLVEAERQKVAIEMAGAAAHELNQPLTVLLGYSTLLVRALPEDNTQRTMIERIHESTLRMSEVVKRLGQITRYRTREYMAGRPIMDIEASAQEEDDRRPTTDD